MNLTCVRKTFAPSSVDSVSDNGVQLGFTIPIGHENHKINEISQMRKRMQE
jgi:hypothetical protein